MTLTDVPMVSYPREIHCYDVGIDIQNAPICRSGQVTPSSNPSTPGMNAMKAMAGSGFVTMVADLMGYGSNAGAEYPDEHGNSLARVSLDLIRLLRN